MIAKTLLIPILTIWIHGTTRITKLIPGGSEFVGHRTGMRKASEIAPKSLHGQVVTTLCSAAPDHFAHEDFYFFGWSGKLDAQERERVGQQIARSISLLIDHYQKQHGKKPLIRVITHSHGGNVALNMATANMPNLIIDELILLACPVQKKTMHHIKNPMFKQIYSIHSHWDMAQVLDMQGLPEFKELFQQLLHTQSVQEAKEIIKSLQTKQLLSERHFPGQDNLTQIRITKGIRDISHIEFFLEGFMKNLPMVMKKADAMKLKEPTTLEFAIEIE